MYRDVVSVHVFVCFVGRILNTAVNFICHFYEKLLKQVHRTQVLYRFSTGAYCALK